VQSEIADFYSKSTNEIITININIYRIIM